MLVNGGPGVNELSVAKFTCDNPKNTGHFITIV